MPIKVVMYHLLRKFHSPELSQFSVTTDALPPAEPNTVYPKKYAHGFVVLCFVVVMQSFIMNSHEVFIHIHQGCFAGTGAIVRLPQCQQSKPGGYRKISQCITTTKHSKAKTVCIFLGIYCRSSPQVQPENDSWITSDSYLEINSYLNLSFLDISLDDVPTIMSCMLSEHKTFSVLCPLWYL